MFKLRQQVPTNLLILRELIDSDNQHNKEAASMSSNLDENLIQQLALKVLETDSQIREIKDDCKKRKAGLLGHREALKKEMMTVLGDWMQQNEKKRIKVTSSDRYVILVAKTISKPASTEEYHLDNIDSYISTTPLVPPEAKELLEDFVKYTFQKRKAKKKVVGESVEMRASIRKAQNKKDGSKSAKISHKTRTATVTVAGMSPHQLLMLNPDTGAMSRQGVLDSHNIVQL